MLLSVKDGVELSDLDIRNEVDTFMFEVLNKLICGSYNYISSTKPWIGICYRDTIQQHLPLFGSYTAWLQIRSNR